MRFYARSLTLPDAQRADAPRLQAAATAGAASSQSTTGDVLKAPPAFDSVCRDWKVRCGEAACAHETTAVADVARSWQAVRDRIVTWQAHAVVEAVEDAPGTVSDAFEPTFLAGFFDDDRPSDEAQGDTPATFATPPPLPPCGESPADRTLDACAERAMFLLGLVPARAAWQLVRGIAARRLARCRMPGAAAGRRRDQVVHAWPGHLRGRQRRSVVVSPVRDATQSPANDARVVAK